jgi:hypothetical protein
MATSLSGKLIEQVEIARGRWQIRLKTSQLANDQIFDPLEIGKEKVPRAKICMFLARLMFLLNWRV